MKKLLTLTLGLLSVASFTASAQSSKSKKTTEIEYLSLGPTLGVGNSWLSNLDDQSIKPAVSLGISLIYSRFEHWGWGADMTASHEGYRMELANGDMMSVDPNYFRFTPKAYYFFGEYGDKCRPKVYAGPSLGFKVKEDHYYDGELVEEVSNSPLYTNNESVFNDLDAGMVVGGGLNMRLARSLWLNMDGSYYHGVADVTNNDQMNRNLKFNVGLMFGL